MSSPTPERKMIHRLKRDRIRKRTKLMSKNPKSYTAISNRRKFVLLKSNNKPNHE